MSENKTNTQLAYIVAASHSGSTLLAMLLNSHKNICTAGELKLSNLGDLSQYRCSCKQIIEDCDTWAQIVAEINRTGDDFDLGNAGTDLGDISSSFVRKLLRPLHRGRFLEAIRDIGLSCSPRWRKHLRHWLQQNARLLEATAKVSKSAVIVDSSKTAIRAKYLAHSGQIETKLIRLVRDGRAVALTYMDAASFADAKDPELRGGGRGKRIAKDLSMYDAATEWLRSNEEAEALLRTVDSEQWIQLRYEDYCRDVEGELGRITDFLGLERGSDYKRFKEVTHHVVGNGMRLDGSSDVVLDERWKSTLTEDDLAEFDDVAGNLNRSYGYD